MNVKSVFVTMVLIVLFIGNLDITTHSIQERMTSVVWIETCEH